MKKLLLTIVCSVFALVASSQEKLSESASKSQVVELLAKDGILLEKQFYPLGSVAGVEFENLILTDITTGKKTGALRVTTSYYSSIGSDDYIGTLDADELDACLKSMNYIKEQVAKPAPSIYTEYEYSTRDGVSMGCYCSTDRKGESSWTIFIKTKKYTSRSTKHLKADNLEAVITTLEKAKTDLTTHLAK